VQLGVTSGNGWVTQGVSEDGAPPAKFIGKLLSWIDLMLYRFSVGISYAVSVLIMSWGTYILEILYLKSTIDILQKMLFYFFKF